MKKLNKKDDPTDHYGPMLSSLWNNNNIKYCKSQIRIMKGNAHLLSIVYDKL